VRVDGLRLLDEAVASGRGVLLAGPHTRLTVLVVRHLYDAGYDLTVVTRVPIPPPRGRSRAIPQIHKSPLFLIAVREALREGRTVFAMIDTPNPVPGVTASVETARGTLHVSDALLRLSARCRAHTLFIASWAEGEAIACAIAAPQPAAETAEEAGAGSFGRFLQEFAARS
jgi:lauroyl/myristoyl acyltransferase